ncbi:diacylglycerol kinase family protein [Galbitalea sp. SE-J8]|uniref:diacylglycerol/lipid kinase family protein n=1 Tax=Galbitalea sp. SE-J8 TaxID=3054952 RepID=UPI00259CC8D3|nr:diacylglycerol kinase family protein [Galbitalea sp. SE-J8]MDM4763887.1 diacylglycerol kinase family protein [Galbitalea sp. SE-J8]
MTLNETAQPTPARAVSEPQKVAAVVFNPTKVDLDELRAAVQAGAEAAGWGTTLYFETDPDDFGVSGARLAVEQGADVVMAVGGDGTVRAVAEGLRGSDVPIALLPSGTGNLLARNLEFTLGSLAESVAVAFEGGERDIDLGVVELTRDDGATEEHAFLVMAGFGLDAKMMANTRPGLKKAVGWLAYVDGGVRALAEIEPVEISYSVDNGPRRSVDVLTVLVGNCGSLTGGILLMPDAKPDDGILDVVALRPRGPFGWFTVWRKIGWENGVLRKSAVGRKIIDLSKDVRDVRYLTGRRFDVELESAQEVELDGDEFGTATSVRCWTEHLGLTVKVPRSEG